MYTLNSVANYLSKSLKISKITFNKSHIISKKKNPYNETHLINNPLFTIMCPNINSTDKSKFENIYIDFKDLENTFIAKHLIKYDYNLKIQHVDEDRCSFQTNGIIPQRWLYIIKDFYWKDAIVEEYESIDYKPLLQNIPCITMEQIMYNSLKTKQYYSFSVITADDEIQKWKTSNAYFSEYTQSILDKCIKYESLTNISHRNVREKPYRKLHTSEGGIEIINEYIKNYINYNWSRCGSIRNEVTGLDQYSTVRDVNLEELLCLHLALVDNNVSVSEIK